MYFYGIMSKKPTCLYRTKNSNFVIIETGKSGKNTTYEFLLNPISNKDALDICLQEESSIAKMMLEMQLYGKSGNENNICGKEKDLIQANKDLSKEIKVAIALLNKINLSYNMINDELTDEYTQNELLNGVHKTLLNQL